MPDDGLSLSTEIDAALQDFNDAGIPCEIVPTKDDVNGKVIFIVKIFNRTNDDVWSQMSHNSPEECIEWIKQRGAKQFKAELRKFR